MLARLANEIEAPGWISFARYMQLVLHEPGLGYYAADRAKFGRAGDFITAPELGRLLGPTPVGRLSKTAGPCLKMGAGSAPLARPWPEERPRDTPIPRPTPKLPKRRA